MEIFKNIATVVGCISACFGLLITIVKPLRQQIINSIARKVQSDKAVQDIKLLSDKIDILVEDNKKIREHMQQIEENIIHKMVTCHIEIIYIILYYFIYILR